MCFVLFCFIHRAVFDYLSNIVCSHSSFNCFFLILYTLYVHNLLKLNIIFGSKKILKNISNFQCVQTNLQPVGVELIDDRSFVRLAAFSTKQIFYNEKKNNKKQKCFEINSIRTEFDLLLVLFCFDSYSPVMFLCLCFCLKAFIVLC